MERTARYVGSIDQGTSSSRFILVDKRGGLVASHQIETNLITPHPGWAEHNPLESINSVRECMGVVMKRYNVKDIAGIGITNQRETTILWDRISGQPLHNAILWLDVRNSDVCREVASRTSGIDHFRATTGLPISTYFSATKILWLMQNSSKVRNAIEQNRCLFGTVDTWVIWNLTGGINGGVHVTDVTNASRTMLMNLKTLDWDKQICTELGIPMNILPRILSNSEEFGKISSGKLKGCVISGCLGDQHAAMVGQLCLQPGQAKNTYGTGAFMLYNTGSKPVQSKHGLLTTVCAKLGPNAECSYALEGSIAVAGSAVHWLRDNLQIIQKASEVNTLAGRVKDNGDVYFVTAFSGLFAPHWRDDARGTIVGLTQYSTKEHIARAVLEAVCFRTREVLEAMEKDSGVKLKILKVDGGMSVSDLLLHLQADILGLKAERPTMLETSCLGAAIAAGIAVGFWQDIEDVIDQVSFSHKSFSPSEDREKIERMYTNWHRAVQKSLGWTSPENESDEPTSAEKYVDLKQNLLIPSLALLASAASGALLATFWFCRRRRYI